MKISYIAFTQKGRLLAERISGLYPGTVSCGVKASLWTKENFSSSDALIYIGAAGIAVRSIAPHLKSKATDPAVIVIDECGNHVIPVLSGHLGGANRLACQMAEALGSEAIITTATDVNGKFAIDSWSSEQSLKLIETHRIVEVSSKLLSGQTVKICSMWDINGDIPYGIEITSDASEADASIGIYRHGCLNMTPVSAVLGIGCRRGTSREQIEEVFQSFIQKSGLLTECIKGLATIDIKADERGLLEFAEAHDWRLEAFSSEELNNVPGEFNESDFVRQTTGVGNVCERSAVLASGGKIYEEKFAENGVTMAVAVPNADLNWRMKQ